jgi:hypothetical protein
MRPMSDKSTGRLRAFALALVLVGMVALPLVRGLQTGFAPAVEVIDNISHPVPHVTAKPSRSPEHDKRKPDKPGKSEQSDDD